MIISLNKAVYSGYSAVGSVPGLGPGGRVFESRCPDIFLLEYRGIAQLVAFLVWDQAVACSSHAAPTFFCWSIGV